MPFPFPGETKELNESTRKEADGSFIELTDGVTHYEFGGPENGEPIALIHGFSVPYFIFDPTFEFLTNSGFQVLRYDLFGRGFSDRPRVRYNIRLFVRQLKDLLDALEIKKVSLIGLSMGGPITASFISQFPQNVCRHGLIDPAGAKSIRISGLVKSRMLPFLGKLTLGLLGSRKMVGKIASDIFDLELVNLFQSRYKIQMQYKGFKYAILSTLRNNMLGSFYETYTQIGKLKKPTLLLWGKNDTTTPFENSKLILEAIPHAEFHAVENCGHIPHYEKPELVNPILLEFLSR